MNARCWWLNARMTTAGAESVPQIGQTKSHCGERRWWRAAGKLNGLGKSLFSFSAVCENQQKRSLCASDRNSIFTITFAAVMCFGFG